MKPILIILLCSQMALADIDLKPKIDTAPLPTPPPQCSEVNVVCKCEANNSWLYAGLAVVATSLVWGTFWYSRK